MRRNASRPILPLPDVLVTVHARAQRRLRIVDMHDGDATRGPRCDRDRQWFATTRPQCDVVAGFKRMRRIHANAQRQIRRRSRMARNSSNREPTAEPIPAVFSSSTLSPPKTEVPRAACRNPCATARPPPRESAARRPRMHHQTIRAERQRANHLIVKCLDRPRPHHRIGRRQIDQVIGVDDQRAERQFRAPRAKSLPRPPPRCATRRAATCADWPKKSAARCSPAFERIPATPEGPRRWRCECRRVCCRRASAQVQAPVRVPAGIRPRRHTRVHELAVRRPCVSKRWVNVHSIGCATVPQTRIKKLRPPVRLLRDRTA